MIQLDSTAWVAISFGLFVLVAVFAGAPRNIAAFLDKRCNAAREALDAAAAIRREAESLLQTAKQRMADAEVQAHHMLRTAHEEAEKHRHNTELAVRETRERHLRTAEQKIQMAYNNAINDLRARVADAVVQKLQHDAQSHNITRLQAANDAALQELETVLGKSNNRV